MIANVNLPGEHIGRAVEFGTIGTSAVPTTGGLLHFIDTPGNITGSIDLPGEHINGAPLELGGGDYFGQLVVLNQSNYVFFVNPYTGSLTGLPLNLAGSPAYGPHTYRKWGIGILSGLLTPYQTPSSHIKSNSLIPLKID